MRLPEREQREKKKKMKGKTTAILLIVLFLASMSSMATAIAKGPDKAKGKDKQNFDFPGYFIATVSLTGDGGFQMWMEFYDYWTYDYYPGVWLPDNDIFGTTGLVIHAVAKPESSMTDEQANRRGYDLIWTATSEFADLVTPGEVYYIKYNWINQ